MKRFQRGELLYPFANELKYISGSAAGFPTKISPGYLQTEGFYPDSELPAEFLNYSIAMASNHANAELDSWFHSWAQMDTGKASVIGCRTGAGTTICNNIGDATINTIKSYTDVSDLAAGANFSSQTIVPAAGSFAGVACVMAWDNFILVAGANAVAPTKAIWRNTVPKPTLTELTLPGAVAADFSTDNKSKFVRDQDTGYLLLYTSFNDKAWKSTDDGATWTATGAPGRVGAAGAGYKAGCVNAAKGYVVIADTNAGASTVEVRVLTQSTGLWASTTVSATMTGGAGVQIPFACNWSDTLQRWLICGEGTQSWVSDTTNPGGTWTQRNVGVTTVTLFHGLILDNVILSVRDPLHTSLVYSLDYGLTWRVSKLLITASGTVRLEWDGACLWVLADGVKFRTALRAPAITIANTFLDDLQ